MKTRLVIFDLDGTLLNTIGDLAVSTNHMLALRGLKQHTYEEYCHFVGNGILRLVERALPENLRTPEYVKAARQESALRTEELAAEVRSYARLLEQLDVEVREVTERDTAGNERRTRDVRLSRRRDAEERYTAEFAAGKEETGALGEDVEVKEERKSAGRG